MTRWKRGGGPVFLVNPRQLLYSASMRKLLLLSLFAVIVIGLIGCGAGAEQSESAQMLEIERTVDMGPIGPPGPQGDSGISGADGAPAPSDQRAVSEAAMATSDAMQVTSVPASVQQEVAKEVVVDRVEASVADSGEDFAVIQTSGAMESDLLPNFDEIQSSVAAQERIIVRTVRMSLDVTNVADAADQVADLAREMGGWVVASNRSVFHEGSIAVRVPSQHLDEAVRRIRGFASRVNSEYSNSQDVTDEYVDSNSTLRSLRATENALLNLMTRAEKVEEALEVQKELTNLRSEIERMEGRIRFLQQTSAFSLINVNFSLAPQQMAVYAGPDQTLSIGRVGDFRATFTPPEGIEEFHYVWDFRDGAQVEGTVTTPTAEPGQLITGKVSHIFSNENDSPYIVEVKITGTGPGGFVEGSDTVIVTVTPIPTIDVFAGPDQTLIIGRAGDFRATFTPPEGIEEFHYVWDFRDGSQEDGTVTVPTTEPGQLVTATVRHGFRSENDSPYIVEVKLTGTGPGGVVQGSDTVIVTVTRIPTIEVFAGDDQVVDAGQEVEFSGSFTRSEELWDTEYQWDFGDGSPKATGSPEEDASRVTAVHTYANHRPQPYEVTLTVIAQSEAGEVRSVGSIHVIVLEPERFIVGNWNLMESVKSATRAFSSLALTVVNAGIWVIIFSPVLLVVLYGVFRAAGRRRPDWKWRRKRSGEAGPPAPDAGPVSEQ